MMKLLKGLGSCIVAYVAIMLLLSVIKNLVLTLSLTPTWLVCLTIFFLICFRR